MERMKRMKIIKTKWQKLIIAFLVVLMLTVVLFPTYSHADLGMGTLGEPIKDLVVRIWRFCYKLYAKNLFTRISNGCFESDYGRFA